MNLLTVESKSKWEVAAIERLQNLIVQKENRCVIISAPVGSGRLNIVREVIKRQQYDTGLIVGTTFDLQDNDWGRITQPLRRFSDSVTIDGYIRSSSFQRIAKHFEWHAEKVTQFRCALHTVTPLIPALHNIVIDYFAHIPFQFVVINDLTFVQEVWFQQVFKRFGFPEICIGITFDRVIFYNDEYLPRACFGCFVDDSSYPKYELHSFVSI
jgi:hypothetical protein